MSLMLHLYENGELTFFLDQTGPDSETYLGKYLWNKWCKNIKKDFVEMIIDLQSHRYEKLESYPRDLQNIINVIQKHVISTRTEEQRRMLLKTWIEMSALKEALIKIFKIDPEDFETEI